MTDFTTFIADWREHKTAILSVRRAVFIDEQGVSEALELDADDHQYTHALAVSDGGDAIATGRLAGAQIGRMAVLESWRGRGVGAAILRCLIAAAGDAQFAACYPERASARANILCGKRLRNRQRNVYGSRHRAY